MFEQSKISLDCPLCGESITEMIGWFRKDYQTCPACEKTFGAGQFDQEINALEQAFDVGIDAMIQPKSGGCCGSKKGGCCGH